MVWWGEDIEWHEENIYCGKEHSDRSSNSRVASDVVGTSLWVVHAHNRQSRRK